MKLSYISLNIKTTVIYIILFVLAISVVTSLIFENQSELIVQNTVLKAEKIAYRVNNEIRKVIKEKKYINKELMIKEFQEVLKYLDLNKYVIFNEQAEKIIVSPEAAGSILTEKGEFTNINRAIFKKENQGKLFHGDITKTTGDLKGKQEINFYIPLPVEETGNLVLKLSVSIIDIDKQMRFLYRQLGLLITGLIFIVVFIAFLYNRLFIHPVKLISMASKKVADGDYKVRVSVKNNDEIGILSDSFNHMVESLCVMTNSLKGIINKLEIQNELIQHELDIASTIQQGLLPGTFVYDKIRISAYYKALEKISGDYYDIKELADGSYGLIIADVSGHGIPAALITIMAKIIFQTYGLNYDNPAGMLGKMNKEIARTVKTGDYVTAFYCIINPHNRILFASAGHHSAIVYRKNKNIIEDLSEDGIFLGLIEDPEIPYSVSESQLEKGDRLILYTDGITDQRNPRGDPYGNKQLKDLIIENSEATTDSLKDFIISDVNKFSDGSGQNDDHTLIIIEIMSDADKTEKQVKKLA